MMTGSCGKQGSCNVNFCLKNPIKNFALNLEMRICDFLFFRDASKLIAVSSVLEYNSVPGKMKHSI